MGQFHMTADAACPDRRPEPAGGLQVGAHWGHALPQEQSAAHTGVLGMGNRVYTRTNALHGVRL